MQEAANVVDVVGAALPVTMEEKDNEHELLHRAIARDPELFAAQQRVREIADAAQDGIVDTRALEVHPNPSWQDGDAASDAVVLMVGSQQGDIPMRITEQTHRQFAEKTDIGWKYYNRMLMTQPGLLCENVRTWFNEEPKERMIRSLAPLTEDDRALAERFSTPYTARAFLGAGYQPLDNAALLSKVLPIVGQHPDAEVADWDIGPDSFHMRITVVEHDVHAVARGYAAAHPEQPAHACNLAEPISFGFALRNSETGRGSMTVAPMMKVLRCINLATGEVAYRAVHYGGRQKGEAAIEYQTDTRRLDDAAKIMKVRDHVIQLLNPAEIERMALTAARAELVEIPEEIKLFDFVGSLGAGFDLTEREQEVLRDETVREVSVTGRRTAFTVSQALTATARELGGEVGADRKAEIERFGFRVLENPVEKLVAIAEKGGYEA